MARPVWNPAAIEGLLDFGTAEAPTPLDIATLDTVLFFLYDDDTPAEQKKAVRFAVCSAWHTLHRPPAAAAPLPSLPAPHVVGIHVTDSCHHGVNLHALPQGDPTLVPCCVVSHSASTVPVPFACRTHLSTSLTSRKHTVRPAPRKPPTPSTSAIQLAMCAVLAHVGGRIADSADIVRELLRAGAWCL